MEFDYVVVGGGSAGATLASRLSEDPTVSVCLLEAGGAGDSMFVRVPTMVVAAVHGNASRSKWTQELPAKRQGARWFFGNQCYGLYPWQPP